MMLFARCALVGAAVVSFISSANAANYTETGNGDLSGNRAAPTQFSLTNGSNNLTATTQGGDLDVVRVNVPAGHLLNQLIVRSFTQAGFDSTAFVGMQAGTTFTVDPNLGDTSQLLGYTHFGAGSVGSNILPFIGQGFDSIGFTPPLQSGPYSLFLQQQGTPVTYQFDFVVAAVPEPSTMMLGGAGLALLLVARRRKAH
jgi:PEP-CTERM motif